MAETSIPSTARQDSAARPPPPTLVADAAPAVASNAGAPSKVEKAITAAHNDIVDLLKQKNVAAAFLKLAFFDAATYDAKSRSGGPNGSIRLREDSEKDDLLRDAIKKLGELKARDKTTEQLYQYISYADLYQLAGVEATNTLAGRTIIGFEPGRMDSSIPPSTKLPSLTGDEKASDVRELFYRMGFDDKEIVALSWAYYYWETCKASTTRGGSTEVTTPSPIKLDNSYYKSLKNLAEVAKKEKSGDNKEASSSAGEAAARAEKLKYYWKCLLEKPFEEHVITYATKEDQFVKDFAAVHKKISQLGTQLGFKEPEAPVTEYHDMRQGLVVAVSMAILIGVLGFFYEAIRT